MIRLNLLLTLLHLLILVGMSRCLSVFLTLMLSKICSFKQILKKNLRGYRFHFLIEQNGLMDW